jgi:hypothetical protein
MASALFALNIIPSTKFFALAAPKENTWVNDEHTQLSRTKAGALSVSKPRKMRFSISKTLTDRIRVLPLRVQDIPTQLDKIGSTHLPSCLILYLVF